jgi:hypothetical protein
MGKDYFDDDRPSWRDVDRRKDRSSHVSRHTSGYGKKPYQSSWLQKQYRKEAEKLFTGKKGSDKHRVARSAIYETHGSSEFAPTVKSYLEEYGLPDDWTTLSLLLDYGDSTVVRQAVGALQSQYDARTALEKQGFRSKLEILAMTTKDESLREHLEEVLGGL